MQEMVVIVEADLQDHQVGLVLDQLPLKQDAFLVSRIPRDCRIDHFGTALEFIAEHLDEALLRPSDGIADNDDPLNTRDLFERNLVASDTDRVNLRLGRIETIAKLRIVEYPFLRTQVRIRNIAPNSAGPYGGKTTEDLIA